jgi:anti-sigma B factor antagonist
MNEPLGRIETETGSEGLRLSLSGEVDLSNAQGLLNQLRRVIADAQPERVVIDLTGVEYIDSQGVMLLLEVASTLRDTETPLSLLAPAHSVAGELLALSPLKDLPAQLVGEPDGRTPVSELPGADLSDR